MYSGSCKDHPRTCGENLKDMAAVADDQGSPPHLRGKQEIKIQLRVGTRITPAPAGKTLKPLPLPFQDWDHPRTCGENVVLNPKEKPREGSPPHLRGKLYPINGSKLLIRITPAPAGKTLKNDVDTL